MIVAGILVVVLTGVAYWFDLRQFSNASQPKHIHGNAQIVVELGIQAFFLGGLTAILFGAMPKSRIIADTTKRAGRTLILAVSAVLLVISATEAVDFWAASSKVGDDLINARFPGGESSALRWLGVRFSPAELYPLTKNDALNVCDGRKLPYLLGEGSRYAYVMVFPNGNPNSRGWVLRVPNSLYAVSSGLKDATSCSMDK
jgi:hypothetical protein